MSEKSIAILLRGALTLVVTAGVLATAAPLAGACSEERYIGSICIAPYPRGCPTGYLPADGRSMSISQNQALFALIGSTFGGDARTNFNLPNLNGRTPAGVGTYSAVPSGVPTTVTLGQTRGADTVALAVNNVPSHTHAATFTATTGPQTVNIPAQPASGSITATATTDIVPGNAGVDPAPSVSNYYLTGVTSTANGPVTQTAPGATKSTLIGTTVTVDSSTYQPAIPAQTVPVTTVTGGSVTVAPNTSSNAPVATLPPQLGLYYCIATEGLFPMFP